MQNRVLSFGQMSFLAVLVLTLLPAHGHAGAVPAAGLKPLTADGRMQISAGDRCPVCAMKVAMHRKFASAISMSGNTTYYFCGTGCMIRAWLHPEVYLGRPVVDLKTPVVRDYFTGNHVDARSVHWVAGSDITGPMGPALVPVTGEEALAAFRKRHGGRVVFRLTDMTDTLWKQITGKPAAP